MKRLPSGNARNFNQAMMEFGALICKPAFPLCPSCQLQSSCESLRLGLVDKRPERPPGREIIQINMATGLLVHEGKVFIQKRLATDVWANLWEFAGGRLKENESPSETVIREYQEETEFAVTPIQHITSVAHSYMHYRVTLHGYLCHLRGKKNIPVLHAAQEYKWIAWKDLEKYAFPAGHRKLILYINKTPAILHSVSAL
jgi:A/G-specific adenine glycosylase